MHHPRRISLFLILCLLIPMSLLRAESQLQLRAPNGTMVTINRDEFGVPHISAENEAALFYGQGYAIAEDRLFQMDNWARIAQGRWGEWYGSHYVYGSDRTMRRMRSGAAERTAQLDTLSEEILACLNGYSDGVNAFIDSALAYPDSLFPGQYDTLALERWYPEKSLAVVEFFAHTFGSGGGDEMLRLAELEDEGWEWFEENRPVNDPSAPTTIHAGSPPPARTWNHTLRHIPREIIREYYREQAVADQLYRDKDVPPKFGSFSLVLNPSRTGTGRSMLSGSPQFNAPEEGKVTPALEVELNCPTLHVTGMGFAGFPGVMVGRNDNFAWTFCSGKSDNHDVYIDSIRNDSREEYWFNGDWHPVQIIQDTIYSSDSEPYIFTHHRTIHGPVISTDFAADHMITMKMAMFGREHEMLDMVLKLDRATNHAEFRDALRDVPVSFNLIYADREGTISYHHIGQYHDRSDGVDPRLPHFGDGSEEWGPWIPFEELPHATGLDQEYFANWNNKPAPWWENGDAIPWVGPNHVSLIDNYVSSVGQFSYDDLLALPAAVQTYGSFTMMVSWTDEPEARNLCPPGQSGLIRRDSTMTSHFSDQWPLHQAHQLKQWRYRDTSMEVPQQNLPHPTSLHLISTWPNPFNNQLRITFSTGQNGVVEATLFDILGREVLRKSWIAHSVNNQQLLDLGRQSTGVYFLRLSQHHESVTRKVILIR